MRTMLVRTMHIHVIKRRTFTWWKRLSMGRILGCSSIYKMSQMELLMKSCVYILGTQEFVLLRTFILDFDNFLEMYLLTMTNTFREHHQRAIFDNCYLWDICLELWRHVAWPTKTQRKTQIQNKDNANESKIKKKWEYGSIILKIILWAHFSIPHDMLRHCC